MIVVQHLVFRGCVLMALGMAHIFCWQRVAPLSIKLDSVISVYRVHEFGFGHLQPAYLV